MKAENYTVAFIVTLIQNKDKISEQKFYKADLSACDMLMDMEMIIDRADLTEKQRYILDNCWVAGYTQEEVAKKMGITQQMCEKHSRAIKKKIKRILMEMEELPS